jgi:predicted tellurium resistance membrane protein TerC
MEEITTLGFLVLLQAVLGFDNLLYISLESKRVVPERQAYVRRIGIAIAILVRIVLLFVLVSLREWFEATNVFGLDFAGYVEGTFTLHSLIVLAGGGFILYTAIKEIFHMMYIHEGESHGCADRQSVGRAVFWIVVMNAVFSFDSILSSMALTDVFWIMATAVVISGVLMIWLADRVSQFLARNRMYEVLGLFILFIVGVMLVSEGGEIAHLTLFGEPVTAMTKTTFYFVIFVLVVSDIVQSRYQKKVLATDENTGGAGTD